MTTIAWDGRTLAADKGSWSGGLHRAVRKVHRVTAPDGRRFLVAFSGDAAFCMRVLAWMRGGEHPGECLEDNKTMDCAMVIDDRRRAWMLNSRLIYVPHEGRLMTSGAGQEIALGALMAGANAVKAIRITMACSDYAARGVDSVTF